MIPGLGRSEDFHAFSLLKISLFLVIHLAVTEFFQKINQPEALK